MHDKLASANILASCVCRCCCMQQPQPQQACIVARAGSSAESEVARMHTTRAVIARAVVPLVVFPLVNMSALMHSPSHVCSQWTLRQRAITTVIACKLQAMHRAYLCAVGRLPQVLLLMWRLSAELAVTTSPATSGSHSGLLTISQCRTVGAELLTAPPVYYTQCGEQGYAWGLCSDVVLHADANELLNFVVTTGGGTGDDK